MRTSLVSQMVKHLFTMWETWVRSLGQEDPLEKEMAIHSSTLAWKIPWTEEAGRLQSIGSQRVGNDWVAKLTFIGSMSSVQSLSQVRLFATPWTAAHQVSLSITNSQRLLKLMSVELVMPSNHLILCCPLLLLPPIFPSIRVFSSESVFQIRWPKYWSFSFSISPSNEYSGLISFRIDLFDLLAIQGTLKSLLQHCSSKASITQFKYAQYCVSKLCQDGKNFNFKKKLEDESRLSVWPCTHHLTYFISYF